MALKRAFELDKIKFNLKLKELKGVDDNNKTFDFDDENIIDLKKALLIKGIAVVLSLGLIGGLILHDRLSSRNTVAEAIETVGVEIASNGNVEQAKKAEEWADKKLSEALTNTSKAVKNNLSLNLKNTEFELPLHGKDLISTNYKINTADTLSSYGETSEKSIGNITIRLMNNENETANYSDCIVSYIESSGIKLQNKEKELLEQGDSLEKAIEFMCTSVNNSVESKDNIDENSEIINDNTVKLKCNTNYENKYIFESNKTISPNDVNTLLIEDNRENWKLTVQKVETTEDFVKYYTYKITGTLTNGINNISVEFNELNKLVLINRYEKFKNY